LKYERVRLTIMPEKKHFVRPQFDTFSSPFEK